MTQSLRLACAIALFSAATAASQAQVPAIPGVPDSARQAADSIDPEKIRAHVRFLSSDLLEGRGPGLRGAQLAAEYIATQFALDGLKPAGDNGTYFQKVPLYAVHTVEDQTTCFLCSAKWPAHSADLRRRLRHQRPDRRRRLILTRPSSSSAMASTRRNTTGTTTRAST